MAALSGDGARLRVPRAALLVRVLEALEVTALSRVRARALVPPAAVLVRVLEALEVAAHSRERTRPPVPRAAVLLDPLEDVEVAAPSRVLARALVPRAVVLVRPLEALEVAALSRPLARPLVPLAAVLVRVLEALEVAGPSRGHADHLSVAAPTHRKLQQEQVALASRVRNQAVFAALVQQLARLLGFEDDREWGLLADATQLQCGVQRLDDVLLEDEREVVIEEQARPVLGSCHQARQAAGGGRRGSPQGPLALAKSLSGYDARTRKPSRGKGKSSGSKKRPFCLKRGDSTSL